ncbi:ABC transporter ATP-binding protein [Novosphingobium lentum]|uniref:ABC transporter ATP-binding protein n=1 Tax=Novosphingobium lentum TaxID=145287 RepID=UPI00147020CE|nr:ABC transporter ATP-binding protein [Novosphingobium lentum]
MGTQGTRGPLARIARPYAWSGPAVAVLGVLTSLLEGASVGILIPLLALLMSDSVPAGVPGPIRAIAQVTASYDVETRILAIGAGILALIVLKGMIQAASAALATHVEGRVGDDIRKSLADRVLAMSYRTYLEHDSVRFLQIVSSDSWHTTKVVGWVLSMVTGIVSLTVMGALLVWLEWRLFAIVAAGGIAIGGVLFVLERRLGHLGIAVTQTNRLLAERMITVVNAFRPIRIFGQRDREQARFGDASDCVRHAMEAVARSTALIIPSVELMVSAMFVVVLLAAHRLGISLPVLTAFLVLLTRAQPHARELSTARLGIASMRSAVREVEWMLGIADDSLGSAGAGTGRAADAANLPPEGAPIRFDDVTYAYPNGSAGVGGVSFTLQPGVATALIGRSGAGKSTLVNLLCRLIDPQQGAILVGERRLDTISPAQWHTRIALAGQDIELVDGTVAENIAYARASASQEEIEGVARAAGADAFIRQLPQGYATPLSLEALSLSGGQRQRIGLARALLKNADLLILDEATSAVDGLSEQEIMRLLAEHRHFRTVLVISHRRSTLAACQNGIVIEDGRIVEAGPLAGLDYYRTMAGDTHRTGEPVKPGK